MPSQSTLRSPSCHEKRKKKENVPLAVRPYSFKLEDKRSDRCDHASVSHRIALQNGTTSRISELCAVEGPSRGVAVHATPPTSPTLPTLRRSLYVHFSLLSKLNTPSALASPRPGPQKLVSCQTFGKLWLWQTFGLGILKTQLDVFADLKKMLQNEY